uniref:Uncharacterized protein n=1 Tax=Caenorhabditis japonica TaxID=281687 RepID=A0A8R1E262_CAEJA
MSSSSLNVLSTSTTVGGAPVPVDGECDGPCKRVYPSNLLNTIGSIGVSVFRWVQLTYPMGSLILKVL